MQKAIFLSLFVALLACGGPPGVECGSGTRLDDDDFCVPTDGECPEGSVAMDGVCVSERTVVEPGECGEGTFLDEETLRCVSSVRCAEGEIVHEGVCLDQDAIDVASADCVESGVQNDRRYGGVPEPCAAPSVIGESVIIAGEIGPSEWDDEDERIHDWDEWMLDVERGDVLTVTSTQLGASSVGAGLECERVMADGEFGLTRRRTTEYVVVDGPCVLGVSGGPSFLAEASPYTVVLTRRAMPEPREVAAGERVAWSATGLDGSLFRIVGDGAIHALSMPNETSRALWRLESGVPVYGGGTGRNGSLVVGQTPTFFLTGFSLPEPEREFELQIVEVSPVPLGSAAPNATTEHPFTVPPRTFGYATVEVPVGQVVEEISSATYLRAAAVSGRDGSPVRAGWLNVDQTEPVIVAFANGRSTTASETLTVVTQTPVELGSLSSSGSPLASTPRTIVDGPRYYALHVEEPMRLRVTADTTSGTGMRMSVTGTLLDPGGTGWTDGSHPLELTGRVPEPGWLVVGLTPNTAAPLVGVTVTADPL